jgi:hypothetical protein
MEEHLNRNSKPTRLRKIWKLRAWLAISLIWLGPTLACGSFAPRPTPTPTVVVADPAALPAEVSPTPLVNLQTPPPPPVAADTPTPAVTATLTPTVANDTGLAVGRPARVSAPNGLNMRDQASTNGQLLLCCQRTRK